MFRVSTRRIAELARAALRATTITCLPVLALLPASAVAQTVSAIGQAFSISFVEVQSEAAAPARIMRQKNVVRLTVRPFGQFDFERERNTGSISKAFTYGMATGAAGSWQKVNTVTRVRVTMDPQAILIEQHSFNFTQRFVITTDGKTCAAAITYSVEQGQDGPVEYQMIEILTKKPLRLASLAAASISCSVGSTAIY